MLYIKCKSVEMLFPMIVGTRNFSSLLLNPTLRRISKSILQIRDEIIILKNGSLYSSKSPIDLALAADDYERMIINDLSLFSADNK